MLFFRSEDLIDDWCRTRGLARGGTATIDQLWKLSVAWNVGRLDLDPKRPGPEQARSIFAGAGLTSAFWDPESTAFA